MKKTGHTDARLDSLFNLFMDFPVGLTRDESAEIDTMFAEYIDGGVIRTRMTERNRRTCVGARATARENCLRAMPVRDALHLAHNLRRGPVVSEAFPTVEEAIDILAIEFRVCGFNWLTGAAALTALTGA